MSRRDQVHTYNISKREKAYKNLKNIHLILVYWDISKTNPDCLAFLYGTLMFFLIKHQFLCQKVVVIKMHWQWNFKAINCMTWLLKRYPVFVRPFPLYLCFHLWDSTAVRTRSHYASFAPAVKPHTPTNVKAVSQSSGVLAITWDPPSLPVEGLQCQIRYHSPSAVRAQPEWKVNITISQIQVCIRLRLCCCDPFM